MSQFRSNARDDGRPQLSLVHPWDPWHQGIGGFDTFLDGFLRYAPRSWEIEIIGTTADIKARPVGHRQSLTYAGRLVAFLPATKNQIPNRPSHVPIALRFVLGARAHRAKPSGQVVIFNRFESAFAIGRPGPDTSSVYCLHNHPEEVSSPHSDIRWSRIKPLFRLLLKNQLRRASLIVSVDPRTQEWVARTVPGPRKQVVFQRVWADPAILRPLSVEEFEVERTALKERLALDPACRLLVFAGRFERQKDPLFLLEVFELACKELAPLGLVLIGDGRLREKLELAARDRNIADRVRFLPPVARTELARLLRSCDLAVCTSGFESGPRFVFEALASGLPVVSFNVGQVASVLDDDGDSGCLVGTRSVEAFVSALARSLSLPFTPERSARCVQRVSNYTPQAALAPIFERIEQLLVKGGRLKCRERAAG